MARGKYLLLGREQSDKYRGTEEAEQGASDNLARAMADTLLEMGEFGWIDLVAQLIDEHVEIASLIPEYHADAERVVDDDKGEDDGDGEGRRMQTVEMADRDQERDRQRGVGARHMPVREKIARLPSVLHGEEDEFGDLGEQADDDREEEDEVRLEKFHKYLLMNCCFEYSI